MATAVKTNPIEEAKRYVANAKKLLQENGKYDRSVDSYQDSKYVKMAGNTLWSGCLVALNAVFPDIVKGKGRPSIEKYKEAAVKRDRKLLSYVSNAYSVTHLYMGYDGIGSKSISDNGFKLSNLLIDRCAILYRKK
ncbi:MAG: DUF5618 family protein [Bacteroidales bacterium]|nr:DUF5618 family protein [Bacteroidales bacterium]MCK9499957.1 DUF5618 family protein [Bacteroidales bacterium]MDY0315658.1 DUF5618 family protein [Bacteroidales bacterium]NLB85720.1 DUF5618 family protein [Bacteroidales bacterium]